MKLDKLQRHTAYIIMLAEIDNHVRQYKHDSGGGWLCYLIRDVLNLNNHGFIRDYDFLNPINAVIESFFPELARKKVDGDWPPHNDRGVKLRKKFLELCIEETY